VEFFLEGHGIRDCWSNTARDMTIVSQKSHGRSRPWSVELAQGFIPRETGDQGRTSGEQWYMKGMLQKLQHLLCNFVPDEFN
jgi:hypothetical protein